MFVPSVVQNGKSLFFMYADKSEKYQNEFDIAVAVVDDDNNNELHR